MVGRLSLQPWRPTGEQISTCSLGRATCRSRGMPEGGCGPMERRAHPEQSVPEGLCPVGETHVRAGAECEVSSL